MAGLTTREICETLGKYHHVGAPRWDADQHGCFTGLRPSGYTRITRKEATDAATKYLADDPPKVKATPDREPAPLEVIDALESLEGRIANDHLPTYLDMHFIRAAIEIIKRSQPSPEAALNRLADDVLEAKRYCKSDPDHVRAKIEVFHDRLKDEVGDLVEWKRISDNLYVASEHVAVNHELAESYLYGAATELRNAADKARKAADAN